MFDPIKASKEIKDSYIDYITTTFDMADTDYEREFRKELQTDGMVASGPFLDIGGSYETGHSLRELIQAQKASVLFERLEPVAEKERELKGTPVQGHQPNTVHEQSTRPPRITRWPRFALYRLMPLICPDRRDTGR